MRGRKYIRFDSAQELHPRDAGDERHDYRIIARARAFDRSLTRERATNAAPRWSQTHSRATHRRGGRCKRERVPALPIYSGRLQGSRAVVRKQASPPPKPISGASKSVEERRATAASVSIRNGARVDRNRIFLGSRHHIFVVETLQRRASPLNSPCDSSDSRGAT
jgi:hypothetical protein